MALAARVWKSPQARRAVAGAARLCLGLAASAGLGWLAIRGLDWDLVADRLQAVSYPMLALALAVFLVASYVRAARWRILFVNVRISIPRLFIIQNEGIGLNNFVPVRVASEVTQLAVLTLRDRVDKATALATLGMERVIDLAASTMILGVAFFLVPEMKNFTLYVWGAIGFAVFAVALVRFVSWGSEGLGVLRRVPFVAAFAAAVRQLERERARLMASFLVSVAYWLMVGVTAWILAVAMEVPLSPTTATLLILGAIFFASAVPAAPSALGTFEWAVVYVLGYFGIDREAGFGYAVIMHAVFFLPPVIIAALFLPREGIMSLGQIRSLALAGLRTLSRS